MKTTSENNKTYRFTRFWPGEGSSCTGTGLCAWDFQLNDKGWYTYKGKLVIATATPYLIGKGWSKKDGITYHKYYETLILNIDGINYDAIVLDSCGACMKKNIIDLFVRDGRVGAPDYIIVK